MLPIPSRIGFPHCEEFELKELPEQNDRRPYGYDTSASGQNERLTLPNSALTYFWRKKGKIENGDIIELANGNKIHCVFEKDNKDGQWEGRLKFKALTTPSFDLNKKTTAFVSFVNLFSSSGAAYCGEKFRNSQHVSSVNTIFLNSGMKHEFIGVSAEEDGRVSNLLQIFFQCWPQKAAPCLSKIEELDKIATCAHDSIPFIAPKSISDRNLFRCAINANPLNRSNCVVMVIPEIGGVEGIRLLVSRESVSDMLIKDVQTMYRGSNKITREVILESEFQPFRQDSEQVHAYSHLHCPIALNSPPAQM